GLTGRGLRDGASAARQRRRVYDLILSAAKPCTGERTRRDRQRMFNGLGTPFGTRRERRLPVKVIEVANNAALRQEDTTWFRPLSACCTSPNPSSARSPGGPMKAAPSTWPKASPTTNRPPWCSKPPSG